MLRAMPSLRKSSKHPDGLRLQHSGQSAGSLLRLIPLIVRVDEEVVLPSGIFFSIL
jgi:hypothetical protein